MKNKKNNLQQSLPAQVIAVTGGKGGVGKTCVSLNLAIALSQQGKEVTLLDADLGLANIAVLLGLHPLRNLADVIEEKCNISDIIINGPADVNIVPAASGIKMMSDLTPIQHHSLVSAFDEISASTDMMVIDTAAGISDSVVSFCSASQEILVVVCNEPASITDAYALIKVLYTEYGIDHFNILVNMVDSEAESRKLFARLVKVTEKYLDVVLKLAGSIPRDEYIKKSLQKQRPLLLSFPGSPAAIAIDELAGSVVDWPRKSQANGRLEFFVDRMSQGYTDSNQEVLST